MADWLTPQQRSRNMSSIRSTKNQSTEESFARLLRAARITGWRRHVKLSGKPDFAFRSRKVLVFIDGCFWHGCSKCYRLPGDNRNYWRAKLAGNHRRDLQVTRLLSERGWQVLRVWEHALKTNVGRVRTLRRLMAALGQSG
jgi:DNA mismatch endonuclease (patch repair protein)